MRAPITVNYTSDGDDWTVTVALTDHTTTGGAATPPRTAKATGLIAARTQADRLVAQLAPDADRRVVHLLDGDAYAFTNSYLKARLGLPEDPGIKSTDRVVNDDATLAPSWPDATVEGAETPADVDNQS